MLSILIPTYNYNVYPLVLELHKQCLECGIDFEILCQDDASFSGWNIENEKINTIKNCSFYVNSANLGRGKNINILAKMSKFEWLLIMDCDTFPTENNFIQKYIAQINKEEKVVFGGIQYRKERPEPKLLLRWVYGNSRETIPVKRRNSNPNGTALTSNLLIKKEVFDSNKFDESITRYGYEDLVFLSDLKKKGILVTHIENPSYHLGLETSQQFLDKTKTALENLKSITKNTNFDTNESKILKTYSVLKKLYLVPFVSLLFKKVKKKIEQNLLSKNPSLLLFDIYKLGYFCLADTK